ncbi:FAD/NAD(P)-binding domain-containing protein [Hesseltinella vesiculosa]|uniref:FAD/NAD(P)-binding domain-containing protein n=1 Tax=Hesseltinella vesiculosa TaxID=101127 RepID=A0A1X2G8K6_9FUNG|nr:FAD/NAD(P)-binding domain-containing protein [Hesseltinella vesiculosa]
MVTEERLKLRHPIRKVAVIGAGPAGLPTAKSLRDEGIDVVIYERSPASGGTWIYNEQAPVSPDYPSTGAPLPFETLESWDSVNKESLLRHAPPTPCYKSLRNNVATPLIKYKNFKWPEGTPWFTSHDRILSYLQDYSASFHLDELTEFNSSLEKLTELPDQKGWLVLTKKVEKVNDNVKTSWREEAFDAVVLATGHYHAPHIPSIPGLSEWQSRYPDAIIHSKQYRHPDSYVNKTVLIIGDGTSALDIARDIGGRVKKIYQSVRQTEHGFDEKYKALREEVQTWLPESVIRVTTIKTIVFDSQSDGPQSARILLHDGSQIQGVDAIVICTGYLFNYHFLPELHDDAGQTNRPLTDHALVNEAGSQLLNLHKDIFYIPNPTLSLIGVPFHIATFSFFEYQSFAVARVYSGSADLPTEQNMRQEWQARLKQKGNGREFHALGAELEQWYINDILTWINNHGIPRGKKLLQGHTEEWFHVKDRAFDALKLEFKSRSI